MEIFLKQIIKQVKRSNEKVCKEMFAYRPLVANKRHLRTQIWSFHPKQITYDCGHRLIIIIIPTTSIERKKNRFLVYDKYEI